MYMYSVIAKHVHSYGCVHVLSAGFVSNGEFNYLRSMGYTRPLSVLQIRTDVHNMYSRARECAIGHVVTNGYMYLYMYMYVFNM